MTRCGATLRLAVARSGQAVGCWVLLLLATPTSAQTLVMPFENPQTDARLYWLGEGSAVLMGDFFEAFGAATIPRDARMSAFERLQLPPAAALSHATVIKVAQ